MCLPVRFFGVFFLKISFAERKNLCKQIKNDAATMIKNLAEAYSVFNRINFYNILKDDSKKIEINQNINCVFVFLNY